MGPSRLARYPADPVGGACDQHHHSRDVIGGHSTSSLSRVEKNRSCSLSPRAAGSRGRRGSALWGGLRSSGRARIAGEGESNTRTAIARGARTARRPSRASRECRACARGSSRDPGRMALVKASAGQATRARDRADRRGRRWPTPRGGANSRRVREVVHLRRRAAVGCDSALAFASCLPTSPPPSRRSTRTQLAPARKRRRELRRGTSAAAPVERW